MANSYMVRPSMQDAFISWADALIGDIQGAARPTPDQISSFNQLCIIMTGEELPQEIHKRAQWRVGHVDTIERRLDVGPFEFEVNEGNGEYCNTVLCRFCEVKPDPETRWEHQLTAEVCSNVGGPQVCCSIDDAGTQASASGPGGAERTAQCLPEGWAVPDGGQQRQMRGGAEAAEAPVTSPWITLEDHAPLAPPLAPKHPTQDEHRELTATKAVGILNRNHDCRIPTDAATAERIGVSYDGLGGWQPIQLVSMNILYDSMLFSNVPEDRARKLVKYRHAAELVAAEAAVKLRAAMTTGGGSSAPVAAALARVTNMWDGVHGGTSEKAFDAHCGVRAGRTSADL